MTDFYITINQEEDNALKPLSRSCQNVYRRLKFYFGVDGKCFPSLTRLSKDLRADRSTIVNALDNLESKGLIKRIKHGGLSNSYKLPFHKVVVKTPLGSGENPTTVVVKTPLLNNCSSSENPTKVVVKTPLKRIRYKELNTIIKESREIQRRKLIVDYVKLDEFYIPKWEQICEKLDKDLELQVVMALDWLEAHPKDIKKDLTRFLTNWISREPFSSNRNKKEKDRPKLFGSNITNELKGV